MYKRSFCSTYTVEVHSLVTRLLYTCHWQISASFCTIFYLIFQCLMFRHCQLCYCFLKRRRNLCYSGIVEAHNLAAVLLYTCHWQISVDVCTLDVIITSGLKFRCSLLYCYFLTNRRNLCYSSMMEAHNRVVKLLCIFYSRISGSLCTTRVIICPRLEFHHFLLCYCFS